MLENFSCNTIKEVAMSPTQQNLLNSLNYITMSILALTLSLVSTTSGFGGNVGFVTAEGTSFSLDGQPFYYVGTNCYYLMVRAADVNLRSDVDEVLQEAAAMGLRVLRTNAYNDGELDKKGKPNWNALQLTPGVYQEYVFQGLDYVLNKADELGVRLILPFVNYWDNYGGMDQYVKWDLKYGSSPYPISREGFYTDENIKQWYKNHITTVLNRVNTINGRTYKEDPTVFAWELANEPRGSEGNLWPWINEMAAHVKSIDANHMLTTGAEGKDGLREFKLYHNCPNIDFCTIHIYPENFNLKEDESMTYVRTRIWDGHDLEKPVILEEFGKYRDTSPPIPDPPVPTGGTGNTTTRDKFFQGFYNTIYDYYGNGSNFWILYHDLYPDYDGRGVYYPADVSTVGIIQTEASKMNSFSGVVPSYASPLYDFDATEEGWVFAWVEGGATGSLSQVESPGYPITNNGSLRISVNLPGGGFSKCAVKRDENGTDYSGYDALSIRVYVPSSSSPPLGPGGLRANFFIQQYVWMFESTWTHLIADTWMRLSIPASYVDITNIQGFGVQVGADQAYNGPIYVDYLCGRLHRNPCYVDWRNTSGTEDGTTAFPYNTVAEGTQFVLPGGTVSIANGNYAEQITIWQPMTLNATGGSVIIGK